MISRTWLGLENEVEQLTGLRFGELNRYDGFSNDGELESAGAGGVGSW